MWDFGRPQPPRLRSAAARFAADVLTDDTEAGVLFGFAAGMVFPVRNAEAVAFMDSTAQLHTVRTSAAAAWAALVIGLVVGRTVSWSTRRLDASVTPVMLACWLELAALGVVVAWSL
jgi:hypothetical protein